MYNNFGDCMRIMGLDYGEARIGVSISDLLGFTAQPMDTVCEKDRCRQLEIITDLIKETNAEKVVVGLPKRMDGTEGHRAEVTRSFCKDLSEMTGIDVVMQDERLSSSEAHKMLDLGGISGKNRKTKVDKIAAVIILQSYLDSII